MTGEQHRVGQEVMQLREVGGPALREIAVCLCGHAGRHVRLLHQFGVGSVFATQQHNRFARGEQRLQALFPGTKTTQDPDDYQPHAVEQCRKIGYGRS